MFLGLDINLRLRPKLLQLKPGTRIVSNTFTMGDWQPDETFTIKRGCVSHCDAYLWIVPAKVGDRWRLPEGELALTQTYQLISGTLRIGNNNMPITNGILDGDLIHFTAGGTEYTGRVTRNTIDSDHWRAIRIAE